MAEPPRRSNWADASSLALPACPKCGHSNAPGVQYVSREGDEYRCNVCGKAWPADETPMLFPRALSLDDLDYLLSLAYDFERATGRPMTAKELHTHLRRPNV